MNTEEKFELQDNDVKRFIPYISKYTKYSFGAVKGIDEKQYEALLIRWYHRIEKSLSFSNYNPAAGARHIDALLKTMENYIAAGYSPDSFAYRTALSVLKNYQIKNTEYSYVDDALYERIEKLPGQSNELGGTINYIKPDENDIKNKNYKDFIISRHSIRHFAEETVDEEKIIKAIELAQYTPSACNRQGWQSRIILNRTIIDEILRNQNGNEGFGHEASALILATGDLRYFDNDRELFQVYIDGGMYCQSIINALHYENIACCPLIASLTADQENNIRKILNLEDAEVLLMIFAIGNYPEDGLIVRSERKAAEPIFYR